MKSFSRERNGCICTCRTCRECDQDVRDVCVFWGNAKVYMCYMCQKKPGGHGSQLLVNGIAMGW